MTDLGGNLGLAPERVELTVIRDGKPHRLGLVQGGWFFQRWQARIRIARWNRQTNRTRRTET